ncbi:MAG: glycoside hydrolase family 127 protein [Spirochaetes bacterium]|nr:glycoside hydrolase family 127 protein [Spirochaetota bacterium]
MHQVHPPIEAAALHETRILGSIGAQIDRFLFERVLSDDAWDGVYQEAEAAFHNKVDDASGVVGLWQGEFWGKFILGAVRVCEYTGEAALKERIRRGVKSLLTYQEADGYLGTYRNKKAIFPADKDAARATMGWACDWNWNIWCRKYTLWGLLEAHRLLGDGEILAAAVRFADQLLSQLNEQGVDLRDTGTFLGMPSASILKPMLLLFERTGNARYLDFCRGIARAWDDPSGRMPNLLANARSGKPVHEWAPESWKWAKAYEMLSCLDGLLALYRITGEAPLLAAVEDLHALILRCEGNAMGSVGYNDIFAHAAAQPNGISEPCDAIHWMRLSHELFALTGKSAYLDAFEHCYLNAFLASIYRDGKWGARGVRSCGRHYTVRSQAGLSRNHCCVNNMPRAMMDAAQTAVMVQGDAVYVNLYTEHRARVRTPRGSVMVEIGGAYLSRGSAELRVGAEAVATLFLRMPGHSARTRIEANGKSHEAPAGDFLEIEVPAGETAISLHFDRTPVLKRLPDSAPAPQEKSWQAERWVNHESISPVPFRQMVSKPRFTLRAGPLLLARSRYVGNTAQEMFDGPFLPGPGVECRLAPIPSTEVRQAFEVELKSEGVAVKTRVCDYASAGNEILEDDHFFSIYF